MAGPYDAFGDHQFWRRAVSRVEPHLFDPVVRPKFRISATDRVMTAGSCFAQHISRRLSEIGFNYFVTETGEGLPEAERSQRQFGTFSARYGNVYTTAQLRQLIEESTGRRRVDTKAWSRRDGRLVDALRPAVEPAGYASAGDVTRARLGHLAAVRTAITECDVFVFTLGLTEAWRDKADGTVFPLAPGVAAGTFDPARHEPVNFGVTDVEADLRLALQHIRAVNPNVRVLLTVSPVPLIATFEDRHVICSTTYSKSVLRVAAEIVSQGSDWIDYFPSFEIITGSNARGRYFEDDLREVNHLGVAHAMRCFLAHYADRPGRSDRISATGLSDHAQTTLAPPPQLHARHGVVCDEEMIDAVRV